jgi:hypothetical protein
MRTQLTTTNDVVKLYYEEGLGRPLVLTHGRFFARNAGAL